MSRLWPHLVLARPGPHRDTAPMNTDLVLAGKRQPGSDGERITVTDPSTGVEIIDVAAASADDAYLAASAASRAQQDWATAPPRLRSEVLRSAWEAMTEHSDELAELITREHGKPLSDARAEVSYAAEFFRWNAEETVRLHGTLGLAPAGDKRMLVHHPPVGVVAMVTPWNFPAAMITRKLAPALGAGNGVVIKPASETPLTALRIAELLEDCGVPPGLVNVTPTNHAGAWFDAVVDHPSVRMVSFTGSTEVGRLLLRRCADRVLKTVMELGGNAPFIVLDDADLDDAVEGAMVAKLRHSAETCTAANRFYAQDGIAAEFTERLAAAMAEVKIGRGFEPDVTCGPMINERAVTDIDGMVRGAVDAGARPLVGGRIADRSGFFYEPTVLGAVALDSPILRQEVFGPIAPVVSFAQIDHAVDMANDTEMGLAAYIYTRDLALGLRTAERLQAGMVGLNCGAMSDPAAPFGGMKQSGLGREGASDGIYEFCETQYIAANW